MTCHAPYMAVWIKTDLRRGATAPSLGELSVADHHFRTIAEAIPGMLSICAPEGLCTYLSHRWLEYAGADFHEAAAKGGFSYMHPEDEPRGHEIWKQAVATSQNYETELRLRRRDG